MVVFSSSFDEVLRASMSSPAVVGAFITALGDRKCFIRDYRPSTFLANSFRQVLDKYCDWLNSLKSPLAQYIPPALFLRSDPKHMARTVQPHYATGNVLSYVQQYPTFINLVIWNVARVLAIFHDADILHESLRPSKILVDSESEIRLTDVGLEGRVNVISTNILHKHWRYKAPEVTCPLGDDIVFTKESDVYAFGRTLEAIFTGCAPLREIKEYPAAFLPVVRGTYIQEKPREISPPMWALIMRCCAFKASDRPSMPDVVEELSRLM